MTDASKPPACPHAATCALFPRFAVKASLKVWTAFYCENKFETCARYSLAQGRKPIPDLLLPNGKLLRLTGEGP
jgi:hypothetical protein